MMKAIAVEALTKEIVGISAADMMIDMKSMAIIDSLPQNRGTVLGRWSESTMEESV